MAKAKRRVPARATAHASRTRRLDQLVPDPKSARRHPERNLQMIAESLREFGPARSIVIDETDRILAGRAVVQAAQAEGLSKVRFVDADRTTVIAVRVSGLSEAEKVRLSVMDNRTSELAEWDPAVLEQLCADGLLELEGLWGADELEQLFAQPQPPAAGLTDPDAIPPPRRTSIRPGDLFELGRHRLICGDATDAHVVAQVLGTLKPSLMVTDPPYGVSYDPTWRAKAGVNRNTKKLGAVANDDRADWSDAWRLFPGAVAYVWHAGLKSSIVQASLEHAAFTLRAQIIWAKDRLALSRGDYHWQHEPCWYGVREGQKGRRTDDRSQSTLWRIATPPVLDEHPPHHTTTVWEIPSRDDDGHGHGTQKPVECMARPMRNHVAAAIYDPFCGSGSSLIAAEQLGRRCIAIELNPVYCQVVIDRWEAFTGKKATKVGQSMKRRTSA